MATQTAMRSSPVKGDQDALSDMRKRYQRAKDFHTELYDLARDDIKFVTVPGNQWDNALRMRRDNRPCYEFPKLAGHCRQVINEMRRERPQGKVRGTGDGDRGLADLMQGICRNIESTSNADLAYDVGYATAVQGGLGYWRVCTDYLNDDDFEQDIRVKPIYNWQSVLGDPAAVERDRRDSLFYFVLDLVPKDEHERRFPDADLTDFDTGGWEKDWREAGQVRIAEYWYKKPVKRDLLALSDGQVVFADELAKQAGISENDVLDHLAAGGIQVVRTRSVDSHKVCMRLTNGHEWLTDEYEFPCKYIPIVPVWGNIQNIDGKDYWQGMVRPAKDQQRLHNVHRTAMTEAVAKAPKAPFITKPKWIKGFEEMWKRANAEDRPYLLVHDDADEVPQRAAQAEVPAALIQLAGMDNEDIKATTGQYDASLGARSNETSGVAIARRNAQGATATFNYADNLAYAVKFTYEILVDMVPRVYDTQRVVRVLGPDEGEEWRELYKEVVDPETERTVVLNDIRKGKYDVTLTVGPSYATQRMEAVDAFTNLLGQMGPGLPPQIAALMAYKAVKNMDLPGADEDLDKAFRKVLIAQGVLEPADGEEAPAPQEQQVDPRMEATIKKLLADAERSAASAEKTRAEAATVVPTAQADIQKTIAEAVSQQLQNMAQSGQLAQLMQPPPNPATTAPYDQPPQGGFFLGGDPQFTG